MEEVPEYLAPLLGASLYDGNEVVQVDTTVAVTAKCCSSGSCSQLASSWASGEPVLFPSMDLADCSSGGALATSCWLVISLARSATVYIFIQNYGAMSSYPMWGGEVKPHQLLVADIFPGDEEGDGRDVLHTYT